MKHFKYLYCFILLSCGTRDVKNSSTLTKIDGEYLYKNNCANCHKPHEEYIGPPLYYSLTSHSLEWSKEFLTKRENNLDSLRFDTVKYQTRCRLFPNLTEAEIEAIKKHTCFCDPINSVQQQH